MSDDLVHRPIPVGTTFVVPLGDARILGVVHASAMFPSAAGIMYVEMMGPPLHREGWQPEYNSWWLVDDLALRDGSWQMHAPIDGFTPEPLRRFAGFDGATPVLVSLWPDTLTLAGTLEAHTPDTLLEWSEAPKLNSPIPSAFEDSLARTMELAPPQRPQDDDENASRFVVANARLGDDNVDPLSFDFTMYFEDEAAATRARSVAHAEGVVTELEPRAESPDWKLTAHVDVIPAYPHVAPEIARWSAFAADHGGVFDGFGAWARGWSAERARREPPE